MEECLVRHLPAAGGTSKHISRPDAHILVIPGIDDERVEEWSKAHSISLVHDLTGKDNRASNIQITVLEHQLTSSTFKQWSQLDVQAERLLVKVEDFIHTWDPEHRPLLFLCHSLGGLILKRLLVHARRREEGTKLLFDSLAGIVFLGSPHLRDSNKSEWSKVPAILELRMLSLPEDLADVSKLQRLAQWSRDFEHLNLSVPILSTREGRKSRKKKKKKKWWSIASAGDGTYIMGSDSDLACTNLTTESVKSVDTDHYGLCALNESNQFRATLIEFCHDSLRVARDRFNLPSSIIQSPALEGAAKADTFNILDGESTVASIMQTSLPNYAQATFDPSYGQSQRPRDETLIHFELKLPCYLLDDAVTVRDFFGREDVLGEIDEHLLVKEGQDIMPELRTVAISGMGGIGKTSIAYKFVKSRQNKFDAIFWLNADTAGKLASSFGEMALGLGLQKPEEDRDWVMSKNLVLQWLENPVKTYGYQTTATLPKARWLLVLDNVDDFGVMEGFWPPRGTGSILMTSRAPHVGKLTSYSDADHETSTYRIALEPFTEEEGQRFLHKLTNRKRTHDSEQAARKLARRIQGYPLFLTQFAGMMSDGLSSFNDLLKMYNEELHHHKLHGERQEIRNSKYPHTTATVWMLDKLDAAPRMVMNVLSFLDPDHIQEEILTEGAAKIKARDYPKTWNDYFAARQALWRRSLVRTAENRSKQEKDEVLANDSASEEDIGSVTGSKEEIIEQTKSQLSVHRVVQDASRSQMTREQLREAFDTAVSLLLTRWNRNERLWHYDRKDWPRAEHLYPHVVQMRYHYMQLELESQKTIASVDFVRLLDCAAWFNHERGRSQEAKELLATAFTVCKEHLDCNESLMFEIHTSLGCVATEVNDPETCYEHYKSLLRMTEEKYSDPQSEADFDALMVANNEMGIAEMMMGQTYRAKELFEIALDQASRFRDASETAKSIYLLASANLGLAQWTDGQYEEASHTLLQAWSYHEELTRAGENTSFAQVAPTYPIDYANLSRPGRIAHAIGNVKDSQNCEDKSDNGKEALGWYKQAYEHYEKTIGKYHHRSADVCHKLAMKYIELGDFNQARDCISQALKVFKTRDYYRPERARTKNLESILARREGKIEQADKIYEEAKKLYWKHMDEAKKGKLKSKSPKEVDFDSSVAFWSR